MVERVCPQPFEQIRLGVDRATTCCPVWLDKAAHAVGATTPEAAWNHPTIVDLRARLLVGDYSLCQNCPELGVGYAIRLPADGLLPQMTTGPKRVVLENDLTCNLYCWSCRADQFVERPERQHRIAEVLAGLEQWAADLEHMSILQSGEAFMSRPCMEWFAAFVPSKWPKLTIELFTNGTLLTRRWPEIAPVHDRITRMLISVDAVTPETYERVRRGGCWEDVKAGLTLASDLRREGRLPDGLQLNFVVQPDNFLEMSEFVNLCAAFEATHAHLAIMSPVWHDAATFAPHDLRRSDHPLRHEFVRAAEQLAARVHATDGPPQIIADTVW